MAPAITKRMTVSELTEMIAQLRGPEKTKRRPLTADQTQLLASFAKQLGVEVVPDPRPLPTRLVMAETDGTPVIRPCQWDIDDVAVVVDAEVCQAVVDAYNNTRWLIGRPTKNGRYIVKREAGPVMLSNYTSNWGWNRLPKYGDVVEYMPLPLDA